MRWLAASACMLAAAVSAQTIVVDSGIGGLSAGATSRLLVDYREPQRSLLLDYLYFGASLHTYATARAVHNFPTLWSE
ncbi:hypothetical protein DIPPA_30190 [Diplonema papillatum]|nr:hypothetical protein DIPPA_30197 [Diplonema papillatum]KAJ9444321.1 hypothetical protein DIPPA_30190 [Diplonema papillatum]